MALFNDKPFVVYFELYGKKMKAKVFAKDEEAAKELIKNKIVFHKVELGSEAECLISDKVNELFNIIAEAKPKNP